MACAWFVEEESFEPKQRDNTVCEDDDMSTIVSKLWPGLFTETPSELL